MHASVCVHACVCVFPFFGLFLFHVICPKVFVLKFVQSLCVILARIEENSVL